MINGRSAGKKLVSEISISNELSLRKGGQAWEDEEWVKGGVESFTTSESKEWQTHYAIDQKPLGQSAWHNCGHDDVMLNRCLNRHCLHAKPYTFKGLRVSVSTVEGVNEETAVCKRLQRLLQSCKTLQNISPVKLEGQLFTSCMILLIYDFKVVEVFNSRSLPTGLICVFILMDIQQMLIMSSKWEHQHMTDVNKTGAAQTKRRNKMWIECKETWETICMGASWEADTFCPYLESPWLLGA